MANNGNDNGPSPYELLLAALGSCTSMTIRMYANFKKISLEKISVKLTHQKIHAEHSENFDSNHSKLDHIERIITLKGNLTVEQHEKLLEIANKCPVHRTLTSGILITTTLENNPKTL